MTAPLATTEDYRIFTGQDADERIAALLESASAKVRRNLGQTLTYVEDDEVIVRPRNGVTRLPQRPVIDVSEVVRNGTTLTSDTYAWTRQGVLTGPDNLNRFDLDLVWGTVPLTVTYTHGYETIPSDIIEVVVNLAQRAVQNSGGARQESIGSYSITYGVGGFAEDELATLAPYRMPVGSIDTYPSWA